MNEMEVALFAGWFSLVYVGYIWTGALPSDSKPGRRPPDRVLADRIAFAALVWVPTLGYALAAKAALPGFEALGLGRLSAWLIAGLGLAAAAFAVGIISSKGPSDLASYPQYLPERWGPAELAMEALSWLLYLAAYEFVFRGFFLYALLPAGAAAAVVIQTALYAFAHLPKSGKEAAGAFVFGIVMAILTLRWGTILPAIIAHMALALGNDLACARRLRRS